MFGGGQMTEQTDPIEADVNAQADGVQQDVGKEDWEGRAKRAEAEAAKYRAQRKKAEQERDEAKAKTKTQDEDYKSLYQDQLQRNEKYREGRKNAEVESALVSQLTKAGVSKDALKAAAKLADKALIEWDEDQGVEDISVTAAVQKLKATEGWMFESKVARTDPKTPADGSSSANEVKRSDFDRLDPMARMNAVKKGLRIVD
jgi:hypothetical protein